MTAPGLKDEDPETVDWPNFGDTCCGRCPGASCYVDQMTGERA